MKMFNWSVLILHVQTVLYALICVDVGINIYTYRVQTRFHVFTATVIHLKLQLYSMG